jgi:Fibronectin type III domain
MITPAMRPLRELSARELEAFIQRNDNVCSIMVLPSTTYWSRSRRSSMLASPIHTTSPPSVRRRAGARLLDWAASAALAAACAAPALAQPPSPPRGTAAAQAPTAVAQVPASWFSVELPGTSEGLSRIIGHETTIEPARLMLEVIRLTQSAQMTQDESVALARRQLVAYLGAVDALEDILARIDPGGRGFTLKSLSRLKRDDWRRFATSFGLELRDAAGAISAALSPERADAERRRLVELAGVNPGDLVARLNAGETVRIVIPTVRVPLPLPPEVWSTRILGRRAPASRLGAAILRDRSAALVYYGLAALDAETLAYFSTSNEALDAARAFAPAFSACGRSLHVRGRRIRLPGGDTTADLWVPLVDARADEPDRFIRHVLERDAGALASFYDMVEHLDPLRLQFVLDAVGKDAGQRPVRFRSLYSACVRSELASKLPRRAFYRVSFDGGHLFRQLRLNPDGTLAPPAERRLWEAAFADSVLPGDPAQTLGDVRSGGAADAIFLADATLAVNPVTRRLRIEAVLFAQRVFSGISDDQMPDALVALRGFVQFPVLMLTLERIGVSDPATYAAAARSASRVEQLPSTDQQFIALAEFQSAIALIDRLTFRHSLSREAAQKLVGTLLPLVPPDESGAERQQVARWLQEQLLRLLPALTDDQAGEAPAESRLLGGLAGPPGDPAGGPGTPAVEWEGERYLIDFAGTELARLRSVRQRQGGNSLDTAVALSSVASKLAAGGATAESIRAARAELVRVSQVLAPIFPGGAGGPDGQEPSREVANAGERLGRLAAPGDLRETTEIGHELGRAADAVLADTLMSIVYATALGDPNGQPLLGGDPAALHDFGLDYALADLRRVAPWTTAREMAGGTPWHLKGSLLALDLALAKLGLRRVSSEPPSGPPRVNPNDAQVLAHTVGLMDPTAFRNADRDLIVQAIERGERRVAALVRGDEPPEPVVADARLSEWRANVLRWMLAHERDAVAAEFSLTELFWLGNADLPPERLATWGVSSVPLSGCLCLRFPPPEPWDEATGHPGDGQLATTVPDLALRMAQMLEELGLPASLVPAVLVGATAEVLDEARLSDGDDWPTLVRFIRSIGSERAKDYIGMLTALGPLAPLPLPAAFAKKSPTNAATAQPTSVTLTWEASSGATSYEYCYDATDDNACATSWTSVGANTSAALRGLTPGTTYYWQVRAVNLGGTTQADDGTWWSLETQAAARPSPGTSLDRAPGSDGRADGGLLHWPGPAGWLGCARGRVSCAPEP